MAHNVVACVSYHEVICSKCVDLLLFLDFGVGSNNYKQFKIDNKIRSHGVGFRFDIMKFVNLDLCLGINPYGDKEFHIIINTKKF